jgi:uncharacterized protein involved in outer membrane biogenesis
VPVSTARLRHFSAYPLAARIAAIAVLIFAILVLALTLMDWNWLKHPLERAASVRFGRTVQIHGPLHVQLWSRTPTVTLEELSVGNPPWEAQPQMLEVQRVQVRLAASQLLRGHLVLRRVELVQPRLYLHQEKSGRANWTFENNAPTRARNSPPSHLPAMQDLTIESGILELKDDLRRLKVTGTIEAHERATTQDPEPFHVKGEGTINDAPFRLHIAGGPLINLTPDKPYPFRLAVQAGRNEIRAAGRVLQPFDLGALELDLEAEGHDLADLYFLTQVTLPNSPPFKVRAQVTRREQQFTVHDIAGSLGGSDISGSMEVDVSRKRPNVRADLLSHHLRLKDMTAVTGASAAGVAPTAASAGRSPHTAELLFPDAHLQVERVRAMDADLHFRATAIEAGTVPFTQLELHARLRQGVLDVDSFDFDLQQGRFAGDLRLDARGQVPEVRLELRGKDINLEQFHPRSAGAQPPLAGILQLRTQITGRGDSVHELMQDGDGTLTLVVPHGEVRSAFAELTGIDVAEGLGLVLGKSDQRVPIRCGVARFALNTGTAHAQNIVFDTQNVLITGWGQVYLGPERLDLTVQGQPKQLRLVRIKAPVQVKGRLLHPTLNLEAGHALKQGGIAVALGALLTPLAAIIAFVDPGLAKDQNCAELLAQAQAPAMADARTPSATAR